MKEKFEAILHPVRIRILQTMMNGEKLTAQQINNKLPDVAVPTLYRHLGKLVEVEVIEVVEENQIRGTIEKVYALPNGKGLSKEDLADVTPAEHMGYFLTFTTSLLSQFNDYIATENANPIEDNAAYRQIQLYLSDEEFNQTFQIIANALLRNLDNHPNEERKLYSISTIVIPNTPKSEEEEK